jgi:hypothetical protein
MSAKKKVFPPAGRPTPLKRDTINDDQECSRPVLYLLVAKPHLPAPNLPTGSPSPPRRWYQLVPRESG